MSIPTTLFDKIWDSHEILQFDDGTSLLHVDRHLIHDLEAGPGFQRLEEASRQVARPDLTFATPDHAVASEPGRTTDTNPTGGRLLRDMRRGTSASGIRMFDIGQSGQGIVHVVGPELGLTQPGALIVCGDSHTCTHGGMGALAFGIGSSEVLHVLATQTLRQKKPKKMRLLFEGELGNGVTAKDMILYSIGLLGTAAGRGYAVEYAGNSIKNLSVDERLTLCNLSIELGAKIGMIAPDSKVFEYLRERTYSPSGALFDEAVRFWTQLTTDENAQFDAEYLIDVNNIAPQITWGTSPQDAVAVTGRVPNPADEPNDERRQAMERAIKYMGLLPGQGLIGTKIDHVFIGSCANSRLSDLQEAAKLLPGKKVASGVRAWVVPGSEATKRQAEAEGLDLAFRQAGFEWREPSCSMCLAANGDIVRPGERCISTSNRNFVGRQGPGARTHLVSPVMAVAAALTGTIVDVRDWESK